ncbi:putative secreted RxLR effector peptide protein [Phytophthora cinnamomi]|uniref:putative secreted RxLR effector peptide protein n=1 Tax=Phytophthora cinnamomi TaxID=4785 RepID=UPI00355A176A|nr:putative secreted RxLR effector peptide protein [Phytophthora cinnamomi]
MKLKGLKGDALKNHENYRYYAFFTKKSEEYLLNRWLRHSTTTFRAWEKLGFQKIIKADDLPRIKHTGQFRGYRQYVNNFDDNVLQTMKSGYDPPRVMVSRGATDAEMTARTQIVVEAGRSDAYAKLALGMTEAHDPMKVSKGSAFEGHMDFKNFLQFLREKEPVMLEELAVHS